jgi:hypothetical protein
MSAADWATQYAPQIAHYRQVMTPLAQQYGLPPEAVDHALSIVGVESRFGTDPRITRPGAAGELGAFQQTPAYRKAYGVTDPQNEQQQINAMFRQFKSLQDKGIPLSQAYIAYNAGEGYLNKVRRGQISESAMNPVTAAYRQHIQNFFSKGKPGAGSIMPYSAPVTKAVAEHTPPLLSPQVSRVMAADSVPQYEVPLPDAYRAPVLFNGQQATPDLLRRALEGI